MRKLVVAGLVLALGVTALALAGGGAARSEKEPYKVAFIYPGPHNDQGWSQAHDRGRLAIEKALGDKVQTTYKENVFSNASVPQIVAGLVREGYNMIVGCSFGMFENGVNGQLYKKYPDVLFEQATGTQIKKNQAEYFGAGEDTIYLSGMAAGAASKKGLIGYVVPFGIPEVVRHTNAFALGAQATHPGARVKLIWTNAWYSPPKEAAAAKNLIAAGADVIGQNVDSPQAGVVAESKGVPWVGYDSNAQKSAPKQWLTAATYNWGPYYVKRVKSRDQRNVEAWLLLRLDQGRLHEPRSLRTEGFGEDQGGDRSQARGDGLGQVQRLHRDRSSTRRARSSYPPGRRRRSFRICTRCSGSSRAWSARSRRSCRPASRWGTPPPLLLQMREAPVRPAPLAPAVRMTGITKRFPGVVANDGVSFEAASGEVHALLGENGAGKTTLSNILTGLYRQDEGEIELWGERVRFHSPRDALDAGICMVHQHFRLVEPFSVAENVVLGDHRGEGRRVVAAYERPSRSASRS